MSICSSYPLSTINANPSNIEESNTVMFNIQKYIDQQWLINRTLLDSLDALKLQPRLNLYSKIDGNQIEKYAQIDQQIVQQIDFNKKLQNDFANILHYEHALQDLKMQNMQLQIARAFNASLWYRKQHCFVDAMKEIERSFKLITTYKELANGTSLVCFRSPDEFLTLAFYHQGKIHRMIAGYDLDRLDQTSLLECERSYLHAIALSLDSAEIHSSLGYLYNDMGKVEEALKHHEQANLLRPNFPDFIHGIAYALHNIEKQKWDNQQTLSEENISRAEEAYERAIQLFKQFQTINSRVYLDRGKFNIIREHFQAALSDFDEGLALEPLHPLLLMERGLLLANLGKHEEALKDLKNGLIANRNDAFMHEKYQNSIDNVRNLHESRRLSLKNMLKHQDPQRDKFDTFLKQCADYVKKSQGQDHAPTCFISYAWNVPEHEKWVEQFAEDLEKSGCNVLLDRWFTRKGYDTMDFVEKILAEDTDFIIVIGTKLYLEKYKFQTTNEGREHVVKIESRILNHLMGYSQQKSDKVIPVLLEGTVEDSLPPLMRLKNVVDFTDHDYYEQMIELIRDLHRIDQRDMEFKRMKEKDER